MTATSHNSFGSSEPNLVVYNQGELAGGRAVAGSNPVSPTTGPEESPGLRDAQEAAEIPAPEANPAHRWGLNDGPGPSVWFEIDSPQRETRVSAHAPSPGREAQ